MVSVREHYENHLARYYAWICGGAELNIAENRNFFKTHKIQPLETGRAFDLGAGCGFQSIPLAELGFHVIAMDLSARLLGELKNKAAHLPIETMCDDILNFSIYARGNIELVVCMGDTLTHLKALQDVEAVLLQAYAALMPKGRLILSFRNLSQALEGLDRFIPVRSNDDTIFTCFLEYQKETVRVHDIVYEKKKGQWAMRKSAYRKLIISPQWIQNQLQHVGFNIEFYNDKEGLIFIVARKK
ncbi:MAG: class I SAM-dependent methyltransferase [Desulfobacterales bacterium]|jgi:2-polyprenyl-3-methyl-5-hydroxy-6-metoxy-1,4-benzoquinol methylase|nr:class I SAM-dependent methyltransferase [Deltaproteobacteria bacterium]